MHRQLAFKADFGHTVDRFDAWWHQTFLDRPPVTLSVACTCPPANLPSPPADPRERWTRIDYVLGTAIAWMEATDYVGDRIPCFNPNLGPEVTATLFGCELDFSASTSWSRPVIDEPGGWQQFLQTRPRFHNHYWRAIEELTAAAIREANGRYVVGITDLHGSYDILAAVRDPQALCLDLHDCPELVRPAGRHAANAFVACFERLYAQVAAAGMGSTCWLPTWHAGPAYVPSCDFWCMVNDRTARELILPDLLVEMEPLQRSVFHLDGPRALRHLDLLLELPQLNAVQWEYGAGNGPAARWIEVYRRILDAGKGVAVQAWDADDALAVLDAVGPEGVWLLIGRPFDSADAARSFLSEVGSRSRGRRRSTLSAPKPDPAAPTTIFTGRA